MKQKISITIDSNLLRQIDKVCEKRQIHRSRYIELLLREDFEEIPAMILAVKSKLKGKDKSLLEFNKKKIIEHQIKYLKHHDFYNIHVLTDSRLVEDFVRRKFKDVKIHFERKDVDSGGTLNYWGTQLGKEILLVHGDVLAGVDLKRLMMFHKENKSAITMVLKTMNPYNKYGVARLEGSHIYNFTEKPEKSDSYLCYIGVGVLNKSALEKFHQNDHYTHQLNNIPHKHGYVFEGFWKTFDKEEDLKE